MVVANRIDARAVTVAGLGDDVERPEIRYPDRETRRAVAIDPVAADVLEDRLCKADIAQKRLARLSGRAFVGEAVACQLMSGVSDAADQRGVTLRDPA